MIGIDAKEMTAWSASCGCNNEKACGYHRGEHDGYQKGIVDGAEKSRWVREDRQFLMGVFMGIVLSIAVYIVRKF